MKVLVLNVDYSPYDIWSWKKTMMKWLGNGAISPVESSEKIIHSGNGREWPIPSVVILKEYMHTKDRKAPYSKKRVYNRDRHTCQYCNIKLHPRQLTLDHVIPKSVWKKLGKPGSPNAYTNVVASCIKCNAKKADKTPEQAKMHLNKKPVDVTYQQAFINELLVNDIPKEWWTYLESYIKQPESSK